MDFGYFHGDDSRRGGASYATDGFTNGFPPTSDSSGYFHGDLRRRASFTDGFTNGFPQASDFIGYSHGDLRRRASYNTDGFPQASVLSGFGFSGDRTVPILNPFVNQQSRRNFTTASMADIDLGLCQNLSVLDEERSVFTGTRPFLGFSGSRNLHESSWLGPDLGLSFLDVSPLRQGSMQSFHGEASMGGGYVSDGDDLHRFGLLSLQDRGFTEQISRHNREFMFEPMNQQPQRDISLIPQASPLDFRLNNAFDSSLMYNTNRVFPSLSSMGDSRELDMMIFSEEPMKNSPLNDVESPLNLTSLVGIYGSVYLTAKSQMGCRVLQKLVEEGSFLDLMIIFREVIDHVRELGMDPFGNYIIQKLLQVCNEEQRTQILIRLTSKPGMLVEISLNTYGTRVVQKVIETVTTKEQISLVKSALKPGFLSLVRDLNGNHVILSCLKSLRPNDTKFILEAATRFCVEIATHRHGCCVLQRCVSHSVGAERVKLVAEIARNSLLLAQDAFGNYVVQYIIEQKMEGASVMFELRGSYVNLAKQKFGSHVVEQCLRHYPESRSHIVDELVSVPDFEHLLQDPYANYVVQSALSVTKGCVRTSLVEKVKKCRNLKTNPYCKKIFSGNRFLKM